MDEYNIHQDDELTAAEAEVRAKLDEVKHLLVPRMCPHGEWEMCEEDCEFKDTSPHPDYIIVHTAVVVGMVNTKTDKPVINLISSPGQPSYVTNGLIRDSLGY